EMGGKVIASDLQNPDYVKLAEAFGIAGHRVETPQLLQSTLEEAFSMDAPVLIEVPVEQMPNPWRMLGLR
ncbi:MAG: thiamine pyrophosphate-dependent enzyme, partial [Thermomicrobiales bacterium]